MQLQLTQKKKKLTTWSCASYDPSLWNSSQVMSQSHISKEPEPFPMAKSISEEDWICTVAESTETGTTLTVITYLEIEHWV